MKFTQIQKVYLSHILTGLVFWYGIEKLFMTDIGIDAFGVGVVTVMALVITLTFDIPSGMLADKWSRKGTLVLSALALAISSLLLGVSDGLLLYIIGYVFYGFYVVCTSGTYQAIIYDSLIDEGRQKEFSKINGRAHALFLISAGVANIASGFIANAFDYRITFYITLASCLLNIVVLMSMYEPKIHRAENKERVIIELPRALRAISRIKILSVLAIVVSVLAAVEVFKQDFGQLYFLRYASSPQVIGILWAAYAFTWALGSFIAHRFTAKLDALIYATILPLIAMSFIDTAASLGLFMLQAVAAAALVNQIQARIQDATPSHVRASVLSVLSFAGTAVSIPASLTIGGIMREYDALAALHFVAVIASGVLIFWMIARIRIAKLSQI